MGAVVKTATQYQVVLLSIVVAGRDAVLKLGLIVGKWGGALLLPLPLSVVDARRVFLQRQWINQYPIVGRTGTKVIVGKGLLWGHKSKMFFICNGRGIFPFKTARIRWGPS